MVELSGAVANRLRSGAGSGLLIVAHGDAAVRDAAVAAVARALVDGEAEILASPGAVAPEGAARLLQAELERQLRSARGIEDLRCASLLVSRASAACRAADALPAPHAPFTGRSVGFRR